MVISSGHVVEMEIQHFFNFQWIVQGFQVGYLECIQFVLIHFDSI